MAAVSPRAVWQRPIPLIGDATSVSDRADDPGGWAFDAFVQDAVTTVIGARRDIRRFRPDAVPPELLRQVLAAGHAAPSVGHSQPWRFVVVAADATRDRAALLADRARLKQAAVMDAASGRHLLDLQLEGIRQAPVGIVVCCDRRVDPAGVLGRATLHDADMWSCACAIQNMWLTARSLGLGLGWVTLFEPGDLAAVVGLPDGVDSLGWLCLGYPNERPPEPGLVRAGWSERLSLDAVIMSERWASDAVEPSRPVDRIAAPHQADVVAAADDGDSMLTPPGSLGRLDQAIDRVIACCGSGVDTATLVLVGGDHPVADLGVSAYSRAVTAQVLEAAGQGKSIGVVAAETAHLRWTVVDAGVSDGNLVDSDAMSVRRVRQLLDDGRRTGEALAARGIVVLGEVGIGNTTVAAALAAALLEREPNDFIGLGAGADSAMLQRKRVVVTEALRRALAAESAESADGVAPYARLLAQLGGPEVAFLTGVVLGVAAAGGVVVLDGMVTTVAAALATAGEPAVAAHLVAGQRSREPGHAILLDWLGLTPLLDLRLRSGEGVGAVFASRMILDTLAIRRNVARVER